MSPFYEYFCPKCGKATEHLERVTAPLKHPCICGGTAERKVSIFSITPIFRTLIGQNNYKGNVPWEKPKPQYFQSAGIPDAT